MSDCCVNMADLCKDIDLNVKKTDKGVTITIETDDPEKVKAMMVMCCCPSDKGQDKKETSGDSDKNNCC